MGGPAGTGAGLKETHGDANGTKAGGKGPIELVDDEKLVTMIEQLELGLSPIKAFKLDESFFTQFKS